MPDPLQNGDFWLVDSLVIPASVHDVNGRFVHMNAAAERASGKSKAQMLGRHYTDLLPSEARKNVTAHYRRAVERGEPTDFETVFVDGSGHLRGCAHSICLFARMMRSSGFSFSPSMPAGPCPGSAVSSLSRD